MGLGFRFGDEITVGVFAVVNTLNGDILVFGCDPGEP